MTEDQLPWRPFTVPNLISVGRLACIPLFLWLLFSVQDRWAAALLLGALGATDWIDGYIARRFDQAQRAGQNLGSDGRSPDAAGGHFCYLDRWFSTDVGCVASSVSRSAGRHSRVVAGSPWSSKKLRSPGGGKQATFLLMFAFPFFLAGERSFLSPIFRMVLGCVL